MPSTDEQPQRIAKYIAQAGVCSRRQAEQLIKDGKVTLNGRRLDSPAVNVSGSDKICVNGQKISLEGKKLRLFLYHKKTGVLTSNSDTEGRPVLFDLIPSGLPRLISIGRLDMNSEGLILLTTDGEYARYMELPSTGQDRCYRARAYGHTTQKKLDGLQKGVTIDGITYGPVRAVLDHAPPLSPAPDSGTRSGSPAQNREQQEATRKKNAKTANERQRLANMWITLTLQEGKNREVRKLLASLGLQVNRLIRLSYGPYRLGKLQPGKVREVPIHDLKKTLPPQFKDRV